MSETQMHVVERTLYGDNYSEDFQADKDCCSPQGFTPLLSLQVDSPGMTDLYSVKDQTRDSTDTGCFYLCHGPNQAQCLTVPLQPALCPNCLLPTGTLSHRQMPRHGIPCCYQLAVLFSHSTDAPNRSLPNQANSSFKMLLSYLLCEGFHKYHTHGNIFLLFCVFTALDIQFFRSNCQIEYLLTLFLSSLEISQQIIEQELIIKQDLETVIPANYSTSRN